MKNLEPKSDNNSMSRFLMTDYVFYGFDDKNSLLRKVAGSVVLIFRVIISTISIFFSLEGSKKFGIKRTRKSSCNVAQC